MTVNKYGFDFSAVDPAAVKAELASVLELFAGATLARLPEMAIAHAHHKRNQTDAQDTTRLITIH